MFKSEGVKALVGLAVIVVVLAVTGWFATILSGKETSVGDIPFYLLVVSGVVVLLCVLQGVFKPFADKYPVIGFLIDLVSFNVFFATFMTLTKDGLTFPGLAAGNIIFLVVTALSWAVRRLAGRIKSNENGEEVVNERH